MVPCGVTVGTVGERKWDGYQFHENTFSKLRFHIKLKLGLPYCWKGEGSFWMHRYSMISFHVRRFSASARADDVLGQQAADGSWSRTPMPVPKPMLHPRAYLCTCPYTGWVSLGNWDLSHPQESPIFTAMQTRIWGLIHYDLRNQYLRQRKRTK